MSEEIDALIARIIEVGDQQGMNKGDITSRAGFHANKIAKVLGSDPRISTLMRLGHAVGLRIALVEENEDLNAITNRDVF